MPKCCETCECYSTMKDKILKRSDSVFDAASDFNIWWEDCQCKCEICSEELLKSKNKEEKK